MSEDKPHKPMTKQERFTYLVNRYKSERDTLAREVLMAWPTNRILPNLGSNFANLVQTETELRMLAEDLNVDLESIDRDRAKF